VDNDASNDPQPTKVLAERLTHLLKTVHPADRGPYTLEEVSAGIRAQSGQSLSAPYLNQLKLGRRDNLTTTKLEAIARFFGVPVGYFFDDTQAHAIDEELALLQAIRDGGIKELALRALELDAETLKSVSRFVGELGQRVDKPKRRSLDDGPAGA
jgi:transcriptional regulator with XRE-family HTH domain